MPPRMLPLNRPTPPPGLPSRLPPPSPQCQALHQDGSDCKEKPLQPGHTLCQFHHREYKTLCSSYKLQEKEYKSIEIKEGEVGVKGKIEAKLAAGKETLALRDQVNRRFRNFSVKNRGHVRWILKLQSEVSSLEQMLASDRKVPKPTKSPRPTQQVRFTQPRLLRSLLDPTIPMTALNHLPPDSPVVLMKQELNTLLGEMMQKLYALVPALNDSSELVLDETIHEERKPNDRDMVLRFLFRELLLCDADADELSRANRTKTIDQFLRESWRERLYNYVKFFEAFKEGHSDTLRFLRDAVCDYLLDPQLPSSTTTVLGAEIATEDSPRMMDTRGWDLLWEYFPDVVGWWNLEVFAVQFEDLVTVRSLIACRRYGPWGADKAKARKPNWNRPDKDIAQECPLAVLHGFIPVVKGVCDSHGGPSADGKAKNDGKKERQGRCYGVGRMSKRDMEAPQLAVELSARVVRFEVLVYDRVGGSFAAPELIASSTNEADPWITRSRPIPVKRTASMQPWTVEWSLKDLLADLDRVHYERDKNMARDYYEFIIIDREPGRKFEIFDLVADALSKLTGDVPYDQLVSQTLQRYQPVAPMNMENGIDRSILISRPSTPLPIAPMFSLQYEGNRVRSWEVADMFPGFVQAIARDAPRSTPTRESQLVAAITKDLEDFDVIEQILDYERPYSSATLVQGGDGIDDLYFNYDSAPMGEPGLPRGRILDVGPIASSLHAFAMGYQRAHPNAVFAKGRINVHYCAWPMPMPPRHAHLNFSSPEGRLYRWKKLPFDLPMASRTWQFTVNHEINKKLPFVCLIQTTLVVCAEDRASAAANLKALVELGKNHDWTFSVPSPAAWTSELRNLNLDTLWKGVRPAQAQMPGEQRRWYWRWSV